MKQATPTAIEKTILLALDDYGEYLTVKQVQQYLEYSPSVINYVRQLLSTLETKGYLLHTFLSRNSQAGRSPSVFTPSATGYKYLEELGREIPLRFRPSEAKEVSQDFLEHTLAVNDFLIAAHLLEKQAPVYPLLEFRHDRKLKQHPVLVTVQGKTVGVTLDSWLKFQLPTLTGNQADIQAIGLELDRGTRDVTSFKRKLRHLLAFINGPYQQHFHTQNITIAFAARHKTPALSQRRVTLMLQWTEEVLTEENREEDSIFFFFCAVPEETIDPLWLFLQPSWLTPFDTSAQILLDVNA